MAVTQLRNEKRLNHDIQRCPLLNRFNITSRRDTKYLAAIVCLTRISTALKMASAQRFQVNRRPISLMTQASAYNLDYLQTRELADG
jgi:hypothetical protein